MYGRRRTVPHIPHVMQTLCEDNLTLQVLPGMRDMRQFLQYLHSCGILVRVFMPMSMAS